MARKSFTFKRSTAGSVGSYLQIDPDLVVDDDSALRGDSYVLAPADPVAASGQILFTADPVDYDAVNLSWEINTDLAASLTAAPQAVRLFIVYSFNGYPQTMRDGVVITSSTSTSGSFRHTNLVSGRWAYYSLFIEYSSTSIRTWFENIGSVEVLIPTNYGSTDDLWKRIPLHYRLQDRNLVEDITDESTFGPLYRMLSVIGWDIDRIRTLVDFQMVSRDPELSEVEILDAIAYELGSPLTVEDLGPSRLRKFLHNVRINNSLKGTIEGVRQTLSAVTGAPVEITTPQPEYLSAEQRAFAGGVVTTLPTINAWGYTTATAVTCAASAGGCIAARSSGSNYQMTVLSTPVLLPQSARYRTYYDAVASNGASVAGAYMSMDRKPASSWTFDNTTGFIESGPEGWDERRSDGVDWVRVPRDHGIVGDGSFSSATGWFHLVIVFGPGPSSVFIENPSVVSLDTYPYTIDIYSERVNQVRDPRFKYTPNLNTTSASSGFWNVYTESGTLTPVSFPAGITNPELAELIDDAVFWIDAGSDAGVSSVAVANGVIVIMPKFSVVPVTVNNNITNRLTPVRIGLEYSFSVIDRAQDIQSVTIKSREYGVIATATAPYREVLTLDGMRRYWLLFREYDAPWLPGNLQDCYIEITANAVAGVGFTMREPLFEPLFRSGEYFDGETPNGGWLRGTNFNGTADYRWGTAGEDQSFSYYATDYARMVSAVQRLIPYLLPVTETNATVRFNRVFGYTGSDMP